MQRHRPGIAKASSLPGELGEGSLGSAIVRSVLGELDALIARCEGGDAGAIFAWGTPTQGGARLIRASGTESAESLRISWNDSEIVCIAVEARNESSFCGPESPAHQSELMPWLVPRLWAHIQRGGALPAGIDRFASFF